jgi:hypothetical protein
MSPCIDKKNETLNGLVLVSKFDIALRDLLPSISRVIIYEVVHSSLLITD